MQSPARDFADFAKIQEGGSFAHEPQKALGEVFIRMLKLSVGQNAEPSPIKSPPPPAEAEAPAITDAAPTEPASLEAVSPSVEEEPLAEADVDPDADATSDASVEEGAAEGGPLGVMPDEAEPGDAVLPAPEEAAAVETVERTPAAAAALLRQSRVLDVD